MRSQLVFFVVRLLVVASTAPMADGLLAAVTNVDTLFAASYRNFYIAVEVDCRDQIERRSVIDVQLAFAVATNSLFTSAA